MPGHIEEIIKNRRYKIIVEVGKDPATGNRRRIIRYHNGRKSEAEHIKSLLIAELEHGTYLEPAKITVSEWMDTWLQDYKKKSLRPNTYALYVWHTNYFIKPAIGQIALQKLRPEHLQQLYNSIEDKGKSSRVVHQVHQLLNGAIKQAIKNKLVQTNATEATTKPPLRYREARALTPEEQDKFLEELLKHPLGPAFITLLGTGLRRGELLGLHWQDINLEGKYLHVKRGIVSVKGLGIIEEKPKTKKGSRIVPLQKVVIEALRGHHEKATKTCKNCPYSSSCQYPESGFYQLDSPLFPSRAGTYIWPRNFNRVLESIRTDLKMNDVSPHSLRHTFATRLLELGEDMRVTQELLGHSKIGTTADIYSHVVEKMKRIAVDKLDHLFTPGTTEKDNSGTNRAPKNPPEDFDNP